MMKSYINQNNHICVALFAFLALVAASSAQPVSLEIVYPFPNETLWARGDGSDFKLNVQVQAKASPWPTAGARYNVNVRIDGETVAQGSRDFRDWISEPFPVSHLSFGTHVATISARPEGNTRQEPNLAESATVRFHLARNPNQNPPVTLKFRRDLGSFLNARGLVGRGAEVGVKMGEFSAEILSQWKGELLYMIDPWAKQGSEYVDMANEDQATQDYFMSLARARVEPFGERFELYREYSLTAAQDFEDASLDFVYLDAMHEYAYVKEDLHAWWPKVKIGGLFCGHDYKDGHMAHANFGVMAAVDEFAASVGHEAMWTMGGQYGWQPNPGQDGSSSWYFVKQAETLTLSAE